MEDNHFEFEDVFEDLNDEDAMEKQIGRAHV